MTKNTAADEKIVQFKKVTEILEEYNRDSNRLVTILQKIQTHYRYLPDPVLSYVATELGIPRARVFGVATFYSHFSLEAKGKHVIKVCDGTACHVEKSMELIDLLYERLNLSDEKTTTDDMLFTVEKVSCLGTCGLAPVLLIDEQVYGNMDAEKLDSLLNEFIEEE